MVTKKGGFDMDDLKIGCVVMAAGDARRFGENKLSACLDGKSLIRRALEAVPDEEFQTVAVVTQYEEAAALAALGEVDAALFQVSDQPLLRRETVRAEVEFFRRHPESLVGLAHGGVRGNPCIFPAAYFPELLRLREDQGGSTVIRRHRESLLLFETEARELADADTPQALRAMGEGRALV